MADYRITCIHRDGPDADYRIDSFGIGDKTFRIDQIIKWIQAEEHRFWVSVNNVSVWVEVREHPRSGRLYLATENDGYPPNNLLSLPECP